MKDERIARHCAELQRCNQRGGRMLSVFDLLHAGTLELDLAAYLMARLTQGASFFVGAQPGGAGKTTVMCALLNLISHDCEIAAASGPVLRAAPKGASEKRHCYICHEIGSGPYFAYLWGEDLRAYCALARRGHLLAANLHADSLDEAYEQICGDNAVPESDFNALNLALFLRVRRSSSGTRRWIERAYESDGVSPHRLVFDKKEGLIGGPRPQEPERRFLLDTLNAGIHTIEDARSAVVQFLSEKP